MKYVAVLIAITGMAVAQTRFVDNSPAGNPLSLAASKDAQTGECNVKLHNNEPRPVGAVVVAFDGDPRLDQSMTHDHFYRSDEDVAMHGTDFDMSFSCTQPTATITVKLVQFNDGQVWEGSDAQAIANLAFDRRTGIDYLNEVLAATDIKAELAKPPLAGKTAGQRAGMQFLLKSSADPVATAKDRLANAESHSSWLLNLK